MQLKRIDPYSAAMVAGAIHFIISAGLCILLGIAVAIHWAAPRSHPALLLLLPFIYAVLGFVFTAVGCWLYNRVSGWMGGVEIELS